MRRLHGAGHERGMAQGVGAKGDDCHVPFRVEAQRAQSDARRQIARRAERTDADDFAFQRRGIGNLRARHQRIKHSGKVEGQIPYRHAKDRASDDRTDAVAVVDLTGEQSFDAEIGAQRDVN